MAATVNGFVSNFLNNARDKLESQDPKAKEIRESNESLFKGIKVASAIVAIASIFFALYAQSIMSLIFAGVSFLIAYDVYQVAENLLQIQSDMFQYITSIKAKEVMNTRSTESTLFAKLIIQWTDFDMRHLICDINKVALLQDQFTAFDQAMNNIQAMNNFNERQL